MKTVNYKMEDEFFEGLEVVQKHLERSTGIKCNQKSALAALVRQAANVVRNTGKLWEWEGKNSDMGA